MQFPDDVDGDVLRRMERSGFRFDVPCLIDFNVDFDVWPPPHEAVELIRSRYPVVEVHEPSAEFPGYVLFQVFDLATHERVTGVQAEVTELMRPYGGVCESWGVLH